MVTNKGYKYHKSQMKFESDGILRLRCRLIKLTKRDDAYCLKEAVIDEKFSFQSSPELTRNRNALGNDSDNNY